MFKKLKSFILTAATALTLAIPLAVTVPASADIQGSLCNGANLQTSAGTGANNCKDANSSFNHILSTIINVFSLVVGVVAVIMIIVGGFNYITSGGNEQKVSSAKNTILYAVIGLVIVVFAQVIVRFVINKTANNA